MKLKQVAAPTIEPVMVDEVKTQLRVDSIDEDAYLDISIVTAREWAENYTCRKFITQTWNMHLDRFSDEIFIPFGELQAVNSIKYYDENNSQQTLSSANYEVDTFSTLGRVRPAQGYSWPATYSKYNSITIEFDCGYGDSRNDVPQTIRHGIAYIAAQLFEHRESMSGIPDAAKNALFPYTLFNFGE